jgi:hypothetical protein
MPDTMIERVARAIAEEIDGRSTAELRLSSAGLKKAEMVARAVLTALGEPDAATLKAGAEADAEGSETNARDVWQAMLGAMLAEQ